MRNSYGKVIHSAHTPASGHEATVAIWAGYESFRRGSGFSKAYESSSTKIQRNFERGRLQAATLKGTWGVVPPWPSNKTLSQHLTETVQNDPECIRDFLETNAFLNQGLK